MSNASTNKGPVVAAAGTGINLALGVLYTWSIFKVAIRQSIEKGAGGFDWDLASLNDPYAVCCLVFAFAMIVAGRFQDKIGPRKTAIIGGVLVGAGFVWISQTTAYWSWVLGFGVLTGTGIAFGYSAATPAALKWYPQNKTGKISGIVVSGFGLASVYIAPLSNYLLGKWGLQKAMLFFGIAFFCVVSSLANLLRNPPAGYVPEGFVERRTTDRPAEVSAKPLEMMKTRNFWVLWMLYFIGAGAGLMVIGSVAGMAKSSMGEYAFVAVAIMAIGNAGGRIAAGMLSDKIGRKRTLVSIFIFQALMMFSTAPAILYATHNAMLLVVLATLIGFNYGANLALFPSFSKDFWGMKSFGVNYGILFTSWGMGGLVMSRLSQSLFAEKGSFTASLLSAGILLVAGVLMTPLIRDKKDELRRAAQGKQGKDSE